MSNQGAATDRGSQGPVEVWRGGVNTWECDEMGHLNVRFYIARAMEGLGGVALALGMPGAFAANAGSTLIVREHHVRFLREARAGTALHMTAGVVEMEETGALLLQTLVHSQSGEPAATVLTRVTHAAAVDGRPFGWPERARRAAERLKVAPTADAGSRSVPAAGLAPSVLADAPRLGLASIGRGTVGVQDCDVFGRMRSEVVLGRISDGIRSVVEPGRQAARDCAGPDVRVGSAALEYRLVYFGAPRAGDHLVLCSALVEAQPKLMRLRHWLFDPLTGAAWAGAENVSVNFDLDTRKSIALTPAALARLQAQLGPG